MSPVSAVVEILREVLDLLDGDGPCAIQPPACRVGLYPGLEVAWDNCGEGGCSGRDGQLWANIVAIDPVSSATGNGSPCDTYTWTAEVGIVRCAAGPTSSGQPPSIERVEQDAWRQGADADAIRAALRCCAEGRSNENLRDVVLPSWRPLGPDGLCVGGVWTLRGILNECC